mmetsp:Transcript_56674/g.120350  ORF Transcript_56674/g.120350 Transcript_56674/m.120350 type:complete len:111 (+) Transcript_56674:337-669(+)
MMFGSAGGRKNYESLVIARWNCAAAGLQLQDDAIEIWGRIQKYERCSSTTNLRQKSVVNANFRSEVWSDAGHAMELLVHGGELRDVGMNWSRFTPGMTGAYSSRWGAIQR